jgi:uncharacterized protein with PQ loop repeat
MVNSASIMDEWTYLAFLAGALTSTGYLPQIAKGLKTRGSEGVSLLMPVVLGLTFLGYAMEEVLNPKLRIR